MLAETPPTSEIFNRREFVKRHPTLFTDSRLEWAVRHRAKNGLADAGAVFESASGEILVHEPKFIAWFLGLSGRGKPRRARRFRNEVAYEQE